MKPPKLFMILLGYTPKNRLTEQHDVFFGIGEQLKDLVPSMFTFWPESKETLHIDCWKEINFVNQYKIEIQPRSDVKRDLQLFFINFGGYLENEFEEYHHKVLIVAKNKSEAIKKVKNSLFYKKFSIKGGASHIDDKYGIDIDEIFKIDDILLPDFKKKYQINITKFTDIKEDINHIGYLKIQKMLKKK